MCLGESPRFGGVFAWWKGLMECIQPHRGCRASWKGQDWLFPEPAAPMGAGEGREWGKPLWVPVLNHLSIFINMQMSSGTEPLPAGVK